MTPFGYLLIPKPILINILSTTNKGKCVLIFQIPTGFGRFEAITYIVGIYICVWILSFIV